MTKPLTLPEIAERITAHLKRMEADPQINTVVSAHPRSTLREYVDPWAYAAGSRLALIYQTWLSKYPDHISKAEALTYLAWLDAGNNGSHRTALAPADAQAQGGEVQP